MLKTYLAMEIDEVFIGHGKMIHAFGHNYDHLIHWDSTGEAMTAERDHSTQWESLKAERYSACYNQRDPRYDLTPEEILKSQKLI